MFDQLYFEREVSDVYYRVNMRHLPFSGAKNFRDLGGYQAADGRTVRWKALYRSDGLHKLTGADLKMLETLSLARVIDFRAPHEKEQEPDRLPADADIRRVEIPILDSSTKVWHDSREEFEKNLGSITPSNFMLETNIELATKFTPEMRQFAHEILSANGQPVLFHCAAGKDRTGFAAALLLRILGVPQEAAMEDYLLSNRYFLAAHRWKLSLYRLLKGKRFISAVMDFMEARPAYLSAAFQALEREHGSFENYLRDGLRLSRQDIGRLGNAYLE
ncbi:MAG: tyrosine-protein phosphatase [Chloroflexota bacterium]